MLPRILKRTIATDVQGVSATLLKQQRSVIMAEGVAPASKRSHDLLMSAAQAHTSPSSSLSPLSVTLCNFHSTEFAERLLERDVGNLVLVEKSQSFAARAKAFVKGYKNQSVDAVHADAMEIFGLQRRGPTISSAKPKEGRGKKQKEEVKLKFPARLLWGKRYQKGDGFLLEKQPLLLRPSQVHDFGHRVPPSFTLMIALPLGSQQMAVVSSVEKELLAYHLRAPSSTGSIFAAAGDVQLVAFVGVECASLLLAATSPSLSFLSHSIRRHSLLTQRLFHVTPITSGRKSLRSMPTAVPMDEFDPPLLSTKARVSYEQKLGEAGLPSGHFFAVSIRPRSTITIAGREVLHSAVSDNGNGAFVRSDRELPPSCLAAYAFWCSLIGRQPPTKVARDIIMLLFPESCSEALRRASLSDSQLRIGEVTNESLDLLFLACLAEIEKHSDFLLFLSLIRGENKVVEYAD